MTARLNFPSFSGEPMPPPVLSMDDYAAFVEFYLETFSDPERYNSWLNQPGIAVPFRLR